MHKGKILIIDDSVLVRNYLTKMINSTEHLEVCAVASNGESGVQQLLFHRPDIIILDLEMDNGNGLYVLEKIKENLKHAEYPFVLIHSTRAKYGDPLFAQAIDFGFCDFILKIQSNPEDFFHDLKAVFLPKLNYGLDAKRSRSILSHTVENKTEVKINPFVTSESTSYSDVVGDIPQGIACLKGVLDKKPITPSIIMIGASTGGPQAVRALLENLPQNISVPIIVIQHMPETFTLSFAKELEKASGIPSQELKHSTHLKPGHIYVFPGGMHGRLNIFGHIYVYYSDKQNYEAHPFKPSINFTVNSLMGSFHSKAVFFLLSGMGKDGAAGAVQLHKKGSLVIAQDQASSAVWGMPKAAIQEKAVDIILPQNELNDALKKILQTYKI